MDGAEGAGTWSDGDLRGEGGHSTKGLIVKNKIEFMFQNNNKGTNYYPNPNIAFQISIIMISVYYLLHFKVCEKIILWFILEE